MNEARVYADGFERSFAEVKDLLEFLAERGRNAKWIRKPTNTLRLAPLEKEAMKFSETDILSTPVTNGSSAIAAVKRPIDTVSASTGKPPLIIRSYFSSPTA